jgi:transposase InsO family protein
MQKHSGCEFFFHTNTDSGMLLVTTGMGMPIPSGNGLYLLPRSHDCAGLSSHHVESLRQKPVALAAECDAALWHSRMGHLNMQSFQAQHSHNTVFVPVMPSSVNDLSCESCNLNKAASAPQNRKASQKPAAPFQHMSCDLWGPVSVPFPYGLRYSLLVIDHHTNFMWVRFLKSKDETCAKLETILLDARHTHARFHSQQRAFAPFLKFESDSVFEAANTQLMCTRLGFSTQFSAPYAHHRLGKAERPWRTLRDCASSMLHAMSMPNSTWSCAINTVVYLRNRTYTRAVGPFGGVPITLLTGAVPDASVFRVFGCTVFAKVPDSLRRKLGLKAFRGAMVGYSHNSPGYRIYNPATRRITTSVHVKFEETVPRFGSSHPLASSIDVCADAETILVTPASHPLTDLNMDA